MKSGKTRFQVTEDHIRKGRQGQHPMALALVENGLAENPEVSILNTVLKDGEGRKLRTLHHSPPVTRWLRRWMQGDRSEPIGLILDGEKRRINTTPGSWRR